MILAAKDLAASTQTLLFSMDQLRSIQAVIFCNRTAGGAVIKLWAVPHDTPVGDAYAVVSDTALPANSTVFTLAHEHPLLFALAERFYVESDISSVNAMLIGT